MIALWMDVAHLESKDKETSKADSKIWISFPEKSHWMTLLDVVALYDETF